MAVVFFTSITTMKIKNLFTLLLVFALFTTACENNTNTPTPENPEEETPKGDEDGDEENKEDDENKEDNNNDAPVHPELEAATYELRDNLDVRVHPLQTNGLRNDYVSFFDVYSDVTLFIDFYAPIECEYLPSGVYPLGDGSSMTSAQEYTYVTLETGADFIRFTDGWAVVTATHDEATGKTTHKVTAYYTIENGETISVQYEGVFTIKGSVQ